MASVAAVAHSPPAREQVLGVTNGKLGMWLFLGSDGMSFMGLIATYVALRIGNWDNWPDPTKILAINLTAFNTFALICSSVTMVLAFAAAQRGDKKRLCQWLLATIACGTLFLGIQVYEYNHLIHDGIKLFDSEGKRFGEWEMGEKAMAAFTEGMPAGSLRSSLFNATFFSCTCFHGFHVLSGVVYLTVTLLGVLRNRWSVSGIEILGLYWHFVDLVWIVIFTIIYLF